jgi:hypothetical protein
MAPISLSVGTLDSRLPNISLYPAAVLVFELTFPFPGYSFSTVTNQLTLLSFTCVVHLNVQARNAIHLPSHCQVKQPKFSPGIKPAQS